MADKEDKDVTSGNWNIAGSYTREMILQLLIQISKYETLSNFGFSNIESDVFVYDKNLKNTSRLHAMRRFVKAIISLIRNTKFAILKKDKPSFDIYILRLLLLEKNLFKLREERKRGKQVVELNVNEDLFEKIMAELNEIRDNVNDKLNIAGLIFTPKEEYDTKKIKEGFKESYINR